MEYVGTTIAIISLFLSIYAIRISRTNRGYDLLFKFYEDLRLKNPSQTRKTEDIVLPEPNGEDSPDRLTDTYHSFQAQEQVETKFNLLCYAVLKEQISLESLYTLFAPYLQARMEFWPKHYTHRIGNYPYTVRVIDRCIQKGWLPINQNNKDLDKRRGKIRYWASGAEALYKLQSDISQKADKSTK